jgi:cephalosporin hydroxylase
MKAIIDRLKRKVNGMISARQEAVVNPHCQELEVNNGVISEFIIRRLAPVVGTHPYPINEQFLMVAAVCALKPTLIFEWGTNLGKSARIFYETARQFGVRTQIYSIDLPDDVEHVEHPGGKRGMYVGNLEGVRLLQGDGLETSLGIYREEKATPDSAGEKGPATPLFFIDGDHGYDSVKRELDGIIAAAPEANILLHDTFFQSPESRYNTGPYRAIQEVLRVAPPYRILRQELGLPGMTLLYRKAEGAR